MNHRLDMVHTEPLNVGLVAKICRVSKKTVLNWIYRSGAKKLMANTTPGGHYRIWPATLAEFIAANKMSVPFQWRETRKLIVLCADINSENMEIIKRATTVYNVMSLVVATHDAENTCYVLGEQNPSVVFVSQSFYVRNPNAVHFIGTKKPVFLFDDDIEAIKYDSSIAHSLFQGYVKSEQGSIIEAYRSLNKPIKNI